jgi:hypothetical protein
MIRAEDRVNPDHRPPRRRCAAFIGCLAVVVSGGVAFASPASAAKNAAIDFSYKTTEQIVSASDPELVGAGVTGRWAFWLGHSDSPGRCAIVLSCKVSKPPYKKVTRGYLTDGYPDEHSVFLRWVKPGTYEGTYTYEHLSFDYGCTQQRTETYDLVVKRRTKLRGVLDPDGRRIKPFWRAIKIQGTRIYEYTGELPPAPPPYGSAIPQCGPFEGTSEIVGKQCLRIRGENYCRNDRSAG